MQQRLASAATKCGFPPLGASASLGEACSSYIANWHQRSAMRGVLKVRARGVKTPHTAAVIFCHGLGDTGEGWGYGFVEMAERLPHILFLFPTARNTPVTCNGGMVMPSWYDIQGLDVNRLKMDAPGIEESAMLVQSLAAIEAEQIATNTSSSASTTAPRVLLGGFSQGGALTMYAGHTCEQPLAGFLVMSGYCTQLQGMLALSSPANQKTPLLMCHGDADAVVPFPLAKESFAWATSSEGGKSLRADASCSEFVPFPGVGHESSPEEMQRVEAFIAKCLPVV